MIVMLGELIASIVVAKGSTSGNWSDNFLSTIMSNVIVFGIWWLYFESVPDPDVYNHNTRTLLSWFTHFVLFISISILSGSLLVVLTTCDSQGLDVELNVTVSRFLLISAACTHLSVKIIAKIYCWDGKFREGLCCQIVIYSILQWVLLGCLATFADIAQDRRAKTLLIAMTVFTVLMIAQNVILRYTMHKTRTDSDGTSMLSDPPGNIMRASLLDEKTQDHEKEIRIERENLTLGVGVRRSVERSKSQQDEEILMEESGNQIKIKREGGVKLVVDV